MRLWSHGVSDASQSILVDQRGTVMIFWLKPMALALTLHHINTNKLSGPKVFTKQLPALHFLMPPFRRSLELISVPLPLPHGWSEAHVDTYKQ